MIVYGTPHCVTFFTLLSAFRWLHGAARAEGERAFDNHWQTCEACREWMARGWEGGEG